MLQSSQIGNSTNSNQMDDEKSTIQLRKKYWDEENVKNNVKEAQIELIQPTSAKGQIPEIKDIYDHIYGNVQSKRVFYETRRNSDTLVIRNSRDSVTADNKSVTFSESSDNSSVDKNILEKPTITDPPAGENANHKSPNLILEEAFDLEKIIDKTIQEDVFFNSEENDEKNITSDETFDDPLTPTPVNSPIVTKKTFDIPVNVEIGCTKCQKTDFVNDRSEVLTEINANLKLELESVKQKLKNEISKNSELNFEIANIEAALETYYKEAKHQKSTLSSIYSAMKNYVSDPKVDPQESYTYKRIKVIADYLESLKNKLQHQDKVIKNNFIENPYYTDLIIKHEAVLQQLDDMGRVNQELNDELKKKADEELDIIKELNRQKFQIENKCKEMENYYANEIITKEALIRTVEEEYKKQLEDFQTVLDRKDQEMARIQKDATARIHNYKKELVIVYGKWKEQKILNNLKR